MKKTNFLLTFLLLALCLGCFSCNKEKTCKCTMKYSGEFALPEVTTTITIEKGKCSDGNTSVTTGGMTATMKCVAN
ncbi:MAG: hypothetical protein RSC04_00985 [Bacteroidales bacterium]